MSDLKSLANSVKSEYDKKLTNEVEDKGSVEVAPIEVPTQTKNTETAVISDEVLIIGDEEENIVIPPAATIPALQQADTNVPKDENKPVIKSAEDLNTFLPDMDAESKKKTAARIFDEAGLYKKKLVMDNGFTPEEAEEAVYNRMKKIASTENTEYLEKYPKDITVVIDKSREKDIEFTDEEKDKLVRTQMIKLISIEDIKLSTLKVEPVDSKYKLSRIRQLSGAISRYTVPVPIYGDYVVFKGAQTIQLLGTVYNDGDPLYENVEKKASLIYEKIDNGLLFKKYDDTGKIELSYNDFVNSFKYHDLDMAMFGIYVASSLEDAENVLKCEKCKKNFTAKYNIKSLLSIESLSEEHKTRMNDILVNKNDETALNKMHTDYSSAIRFQSTYTKNVYELSYPSLAKAINVLRVIHDKDQSMVYYALTAMLIDKIYFYDTYNDNYIEMSIDGIDDEEKRKAISDLVDLFTEIPEQDLTLLFKQSKDMIPYVDFILDSTCEHCGFKMKNLLSMDNLVFLKAQNMPGVTE